MDNSQAHVIFCSPTVGVQCHQVQGCMSSGLNPCVIAWAKWGLRRTANPHGGEKCLFQLGGDLSRKVGRLLASRRGRKGV